MKVIIFSSQAISHILIIAASLLISSCSLQKITVDQTAEVMLAGSRNFEAESDLAIAEASAPSNLKFIEGLLESSPNNRTLLYIAAKFYTNYSFAFIEPRLVGKANAYDDDYLKTQEQAKRYYLRGRDYALRWMATRRPELADLLKKEDDSQWKSKLPELLNQLDEKDLPSLYWIAQSWGSAININLADIDAIFHLPKVEMLMTRVLELDPDYEYGGAHLFFGVLIAKLGEQLGSGPELAKAHFEKADKVTDNKYLMSQFLYARYYCVTIQDRECYTSTLNKVISSDINGLPEQRLANVLAVEWSGQWLEFVDELF